MKTALAALICGLSLQVHATTFATDASDVWWNENEGGWGVNVIQENDILFLSFFLYGSNNQPTWYSASNVQFTGQSGSSLVYSGEVVQTTGPWFGVPFNSSQVGRRTAGTVTFTLTSINAATLNLAVDGVTLNKQLTRYTWRTNDISGTYIGAQVGTYSGCSPSSLNGYSEAGSTYIISQSGSSISIQEVAQGATCTYTGTYVQRGRMGSSSNGQYSCTGGVFGPFNVFELEANRTGFTARANASDNYCNFSGRIGGLRRGG